MKYSTTYTGIIIMTVASSLLVTFGLSEGCADEITNKYIPALVALIGGGGATAAYGRYKAGGVTHMGFKK